VDEHQDFFEYGDQRRERLLDDVRGDWHAFWWLFGCLGCWSWDWILNDWRATELPLGLLTELLGLDCCWDLDRGTGLLGLNCAAHCDPKLATE